MKIAILTDFYDPHIQGGAEVCSKFIAEGLSKDLDIHVITPNLDEDIDKTEIKENLFIHRFKSPLRRKLLEKGKKTSEFLHKNKKTFSLIHKFYKKYSAYDLAKAFKKLYEKYNFDMLHANNVEPAIALGHIKNIPKIAHIRDYHFFQQKIKADKYIAINRRMEEMAEKQGYENITIIHDPIEEYKISDKTKEEARQHLKLPYEKICLFMGHFIWETDPTIMLKIAEDNPDIDFVLCGDGPIKLKSDLKNVHLMGRIPSEKAADYYKAADLTFYPCNVDWGFGLVVVESMANGTPVLSYPIRGVDEVIDDGKNGFISIDPKIIKEIFKKDLKKIGEEAKKIRKDFDKENILDELRNLFQSVRS